MPAKGAGASARRVEKNGFYWPNCGEESIGGNDVHVLDFETRSIRNNATETDRGAIGGYDDARRSRDLECFSSRRRAEIRHNRVSGERGVTGDERRRRILNEEQTLPECAEIAERDST